MSKDLHTAEVISLARSTLTKTIMETSTMTSILYQHSNIGAMERARFDGSQEAIKMSTD